MADGDNAKHVTQMLLKAKSVIVIIGAGVSIAAGIPSFRGAGRMQGTLEDKPIQDAMSTHIRGDDVLRKEHCKIISTLAGKTIVAKPTSFHRLLRALDNAGTLIRLYTQNIDGLEGKAGFDLLDQSSKARCIALHGSLMDLRCNNCSSVISMESAFHILKSGVLPTCSNTERGLGNLRKRTGNCGVLYPDIVLYGEPVKDEEYITAAANHDLRRISKNTLILVVGTSLKIPGIIAMIRKFSSAAKSKGGEIVYIDTDPNIPENLHQCFGMIVKMDCQTFAQEVFSGLNSKGVDELKEVETRKDMRPLWDWDYV